MMDFLKNALAQVPAYFLTFPRVFSRPRSFGREIAIATSKATTTTKLNDSLMFLALSLLITAILKAAVFGDAGVGGSYLAKDAIWKAFLVLALAGVMRISWRIMGGRAPFEKYVVANCYYFGVLSVLVHLVLLMGKKATGSVLRLPPLTFVIFYACTIGPLLLWALYCWRVYADLNSATWKQYVGSLIILLLFGSPVLAFSYGLRFALIGHVFRDWF